MSFKSCVWSWLRLSHVGNTQEEGGCQWPLHAFHLSLLAKLTNATLEKYQTFLWAKFLPVIDWMDRDRGGWLHLQCNKTLQRRSVITNSFVYLNPRVLFILPWSGYDRGTEVTFPSAAAFFRNAISITCRTTKQFQTPRNPQFAVQTSNVFVLFCLFLLQVVSEDRVED